MQMISVIDGLEPLYVHATKKLYRMCYETILYSRVPAIVPLNMNMWILRWLPNEPVLLNRACIQSGWLVSVSCALLRRRLSTRSASQASA